jgi:hypothetical protein
MVPIIIFLCIKNQFIGVFGLQFFCLMGGYLLTNFYDATVRIGDTLVILGAFFGVLILFLLENCKKI